MLRRAILTPPVSQQSGVGYLRMASPHPAPVSARVLLAVLAYILLHGCVPTVSKYQKIDAVGARYFHNLCHGPSGPPSIVYYPYHGIFISLDITWGIALGLHLPAGTEAYLDGNTIRIAGLTETGSVDVSLPLRAARQGSLGNGAPPEFRGLPDPFSSREHFGPLAGASESGHHIWYSFISESVSEPVHVLAAPEGLLRGTVELPPMTINGEHYGPQTLHFERRTHGEIVSPVNC